MNHLFSEGTQRDDDKLDIEGGSWVLIQKSYSKHLGLSTTGKMKLSGDDDKPPVTELVLGYN